MAVLSVHNLEMSFSERVLFSQVSFDIEASDKVGFIGVNGVGKTTLFKILCGKMEQTGGDFFTSKNLKIGYMEQHACSNSENTVYNELLSVFPHLIRMEEEIDRLNLDLEMGRSDEKTIMRHTELSEQFAAMDGLVYKSRTASALTGLGFKQEDFNMPVKKLSGGQRSKLSLAKLLLSGSDIILLDEPTNHLDINSVGWLESFIRDFKGAAIIISHDRYFLDTVTNKTMELEHEKLQMYKGNYTEFIRKKEEAKKAAENKYKKDMAEIKRIEGIIEQQKRWNREKNIKTAESKQKEIDRIKENLVVPESELENIKFKFQPNTESGNDVLMCEGVSKTFGEKKIFENVNMHIRKGEKVFIVGSNGCGKTTLFRIIMGTVPADRGEIDFGAKVETEYFDQMQENLNMEKTAMDEIWDEYPKMTQTQVRTSLGAFLFKGDEVFKPINQMSGGERARVSLLKLMLGGGNFLLLDEPTNHLDTTSREALEESLKSYEGTMLIISHDRYFINKLSDRILELKPEGMTEYLGNYDYYMEKRLEKSGQDSGKTHTETKKSAGAIDYKMKKEMQAQERKRRSMLKKTEQEIEETELEMEKVNEQLADPQVTSDYQKLIELSGKLEELKAKQEQLYEQWAELSD
ncbi:ABC transporter ATP-binding protein [Anaeromassilibacillus sp. An172]|uniref:ribosomal protection-like ABC-F family protein n=1 Tax=Anaeromassilibacillus sp. An172 TaxID=1965570 RepID=UPI000B3A005D|nr:ABC-F family ATP-binding cassette domain-containing protein [Anaeromassilibacillus sp. An172]OUP80075.1 ABC transporter ATP-binding protein [Anaeromassilibacillus sp. An172]